MRDKEWMDESLDRLRGVMSRTIYQAYARHAERVCSQEFARPIVDAIYGAIGGVDTVRMIGVGEEINRVMAPVIQRLKALEEFQERIRLLIRYRKLEFGGGMCALVGPGDPFIMDATLIGNDGKRVRVNGNCDFVVLIERCWDELKGARPEDFQR